MTKLMVAFSVMIMLFTAASMTFTRMYQLVEKKDKFDRCVEFANKISNPLGAAEYIKHACKPIRGEK